MTTETNFYYYSRVLPYLPEYRQKYLIKNINADASVTYAGVEVHANAIAIDYHIQHIKDLLAGMGYNVSGDSNNEKILIK